MQRWRRSPTTEAHNVFFFFPRSQLSTLAICLDFGGAFPNYSLWLCNLLLVGSHGRILCCKQSSDVSLGFSFCMEFLGEFWSIINKRGGGNGSKKEKLAANKGLRKYWERCRSRVVMPVPQLWDQQWPPIRCSKASWTMATLMICESRYWTSWNRM